MSNIDDCREFDAASPMLASLVDGPLPLGMWRFLGLAPRPMALVDPFRSTRVDPARGQRALDVLQGHELFQALAAVIRRPGI